MRIKFSRKMPALILALAGVIAATTLVAGARRAAATAVTPERLAELQRTAADPAATAESWRAYARSLRTAERPALAAEAWRRARSMDRFCDEAAEGLAIALAEADAAHDLFAHLEALTLEDARLALRLLASPTLSRYAAHPRYRPLLVEARSQAVD